MDIVLAGIWQHMQAGNLGSISFGFLVSSAFFPVMLVPFPRLAHSFQGNHRYSNFTDTLIHVYCEISIWPAVVLW